jgi:hypothetical protein
MMNVRRPRDAVVGYSFLSYHLYTGGCAAAGR